MPAHFFIIYIFSCTFFEVLLYRRKTLSQFALWSTAGCRKASYMSCLSLESFFKKKDALTWKSVVHRGGSDTSHPLVQCPNAWWPGGGQKLHSGFPWGRQRPWHLGYLLLLRPLARSWIESMFNEQQHTIISWSCLTMLPSAWLPVGNVSPISYHVATVSQIKAGLQALEVNVLWRATQAGQQVWQFSSSQ